jgi:hypothetical protein
MSPYREVEQIRHSAASLRKEAEGALGEERRLLLSSVEELERLADGMKPGSVPTTGEVARQTGVSRNIDAIFARAHHALARHHHLQAKRAWDTGETTQAGRALKAAATHLQQGLGWVNHPLGEAGAHTITTAQRRAELLIQGAGVSAVEVGTGIEALGGEIEKLGRQAESLKGP